MNQIKVSVVIPSYNSSKMIEKCLNSFQKQDNFNNNFNNFEVIVVDSSSDNTASIIKENFPWVKLYSFPDRKYAGVARNHGISKSLGDIIVFTDSDCFVDSNWINQIIETHDKKNEPLIGGAIDNGNPESYLGWVYYFASFIRWLPGKNNYELTDLATGCLTVKKWVFEKYGYFSEARFCEDTEFCWQVAQQGYTPLFVPEIKVYHLNPNSWKKIFLQKVIHGKSFAQMRVNKFHFSQQRLIIYLLGSLCLPFILLYRNVKKLIQAQIYFREYILCLPLIFLVLIVWSYGEFLGYSQTLIKGDR